MSVWFSLFKFVASTVQSTKKTKRTNVCVVCLSMSRCAPISYPMLLVCLNGLGTCTIVLVEQGIPSFKIPSTTPEQPKLLSHCIENTVLSQHGVPILLCHAHVTVTLTRMSVSLQIKSQKIVDIAIQLALFFFLALIILKLGC